MMKKKFEEGCQERINKIEYSIFMLPGLKNHDKLPWYIILYICL